MLDVKRQARVSEEAPQQGRMSPQAAALATDMPADLLNAIRREIREAGVLQVAPEQFHRVEFGRVGRQPGEVPATMSDQPGGDDPMLVGESAIPDEDDRTAHVATKVLEKPTPLRPANVLSARARVSCRRRGDTISAPIPETFSCERARTASGGGTPRGAQVRRSTGSIKNPVSSRQTRWAPSRRSFFGSPGESVGKGMTHPVLGSGKMAVRADHQAREGERDAVEDYPESDPSAAG